MKLKNIILLILSFFIFIINIHANSINNISITNPSYKPRNLLYNLDNEIHSKIKQDINNLDLSNYSNKNSIIEIITTRSNIILESYGYYNTNIEVKLTSSSDKKYNINIILKYKKPVILNNINIQIITKNKKLDNLDYLKELITNYKFLKSKPFNQEQYLDLKSNLLQAAKNHGYLDANYTIHQVKINKANKTADIELILDLNKLYYLNTIKIIKNHHNYNLDSGFIFSFLPYYSEQNPIINYGYNYDSIKLNNIPYNNLDILKLQNDLSRYIRETNIKTDRDDLNKQVNISISTTPLRHYLYNIGAGYDTNEGARIFSGIQIRNISSYGHKLDIKAKVAQYKKTAEIHYLIPGFNPASDLFSIGYDYRFDNKRNGNNIEKERNQLISQYQRTLDDGKLQLTPGISYRLEKFRDIKNNKNRESELFAPYFIYDQVLTTNRIQTYQGHHLNLLIEGANDNILSTTSFVKLHTKTKSIIPLRFLVDDLRFIFKSQFGQVWHTEQTEIPPTIRFFAGGTDTVRGYRFESLGPTAINAKGKRIIIGGDRLLTLSGELEQRVYKDWSVAVFYDVGNALNSWDNFDNNLYSGAGFGIRWQSPIGAIRIDLANALDQKHKPWRFDFNIGPDL